MNPYLLALLLYGVVLIVIGLILSRKVRGSDDFFVAGRRLGPGLLFSTLLTANIGAGSTVGAAGLGYHLGLSAWWWVGSAGIGSLFLAFLIGPKIRDLAERHGFLTVGDFLEFRYSQRLRILAAILLWLGTLAILAGQLIAVSKILSAVAGTSKITGCLLGGLVVVIYFTAGGLKGSAWINVIQLIVKGFGFILATALILSLMEGWDGLNEKLLEGNLHPEAFVSWTGIGAGGILAYLVLLVPAFIVSPGLLQKVYGARNSRAVRVGVGANGMVLLFYSFFPVLLGMSAAVLIPGLEDPEMGLPHLMTDWLPFGLGALLLAAVFSAEVSSADAALLMLSTALTRDLYQKWLKPEVEDRELLKLSRIASVLAGVLGVALAALLPSVISALSIFYALTSVTFFAPIVLGIYTARPLPACFSAVMISVVTTSLVHILTQGQGFWHLPPTAVGILLSLVLLGFGLVRSR